MRFVFYVAYGYRFDDRSLEGQGVGGSENALILLTRTLAQRGHQVRVFNEPDEEGTYHGVQYLWRERFATASTGDVLVLFRAPMPQALLRQARFRTTLFYCLDQRTTGNWQRELFPCVGAVVCISRYHADYLRDVHRCPAHLLRVISVGIEAARYVHPLPKLEGKLLYCSGPNRGLRYVAEIFPRIRREIPPATLVITSDYRLWGHATPGNAQWVRRFAHQPGVTFLGKVTREELIRHQLESVLMVYPCTFEENFCISAMECQAAGTPVVTTRIGALETTVLNGQTGIVIDDHPTTRRYQTRFIAETCRLLRDHTAWEAMSRRGRERAREEFTWERIAVAWEGLAASVMAAHVPPPSQEDSMVRQTP